jgi:quinol monooxygenase YgiN
MTASHLPVGAGDSFAMVVELRSAPGRREDLRSAMLAILGPTRAEKGCLRYDLHEDREDPDVLAIYEVWSDAAALGRHRDTDHVREINSRIHELTVGELRRLQLRLIEPAGPLGDEQPR